MLGIHITSFFLKLQNIEDLLIIAHGILCGCINALFIFPSRHIHLVRDYFYIDGLW